ncbi:hypothetical protein Glove_344g81 [Diversispora epigaea]|uniref:Uncharacterized protein n=1 Tax=Diversispora epigaea TaxID=1348612 RepID=A0A397HKB2_9GLOM|nr:hypothetical protein Glove_344g81 [Diversispora epigaea]
MFLYNFKVQNINAYLDKKKLKKRCGAKLRNSTDDYFANELNVLFLFGRIKHKKKYEKEKTKEKTKGKLEGELEGKLEGELEGKLKVYTRSNKNKNPSPIYENKEQSYPTPSSKKNKSHNYEDEVEQFCPALSANKKNKNFTTLQSPINSRSHSFSSKEAEADLEVNHNNFSENYDYNNQNQHDKRNELNENNEYKRNKYVEYDNDNQDNNNQIIPNLLVLEKISVFKFTYFVTLRPHILNLANKIFEGNNMSSISYISVSTSSASVLTSPVISPSELSLLREQSKLLFLRTRICPKGLKEEIIRRIRPGIDMHSSVARSIIEKFSSMINSDRDKLNTFALTSAKEIIEGEKEVLNVNVNTIEKLVTKDSIKLVFNSHLKYVRLPQNNEEEMKKLLELYQAVVKIHIINKLKDDQKSSASLEVKNLDYIIKNLKFNSVSGKNYVYEFDLDHFV